MRFLTYFFISVILSFAVPYFLAKNKRFYFFGIGTLVLGSSLYIYPYIIKTVALEDYQVSKVNYQKVYFDEDLKRPVLISEDKKYSFSISAVSNIDESSYSEIIEKLKLSSQAKIWFIEGSNDFLIIKGIETEKYYLSPSKSLIYDNDTRWFKIGSTFFFTLGGVAIVLAIFDSYFKN